MLLIPLSRSGHATDRWPELLNSPSSSQDAWDSLLQRFRQYLREW